LKNNYFSVIIVYELLFSKNKGIAPNKTLSRIRVLIYAFIVRVVTRDYYRLLFVIRLSNVQFSFVSTFYLSTSVHDRTLKFKIIQYFKTKFKSIVLLF